MKRLIAFAFAVAVALPLVAATRTWTGTNSGLWSDPGNWGGTVPSSGDALVFPLGLVFNKSMTNDLVGFGTDSITFTGNGYTLDGNSIDISGGGITLGGNETIKVPIVANLLAGLASTGGGFSSFSGVISGTGPLIINGPEEILFTGANTVTGQLTFSGSDVFTIDGGTWPGAIALVSNTTIIGGGATVGPVTVHTGATFSPASTNPPTFANGGNLTLQAGSTYKHVLTFNPTYNVTGTVDLGGATLKLLIGPGNFVPAGPFPPIINNDGSDAVIGTFAGLPEGATVFSDSLQGFTISYVGGSGNDVTLTALPVTTATALMTSATPVTVGQPVTFTATVTPNGTSPSPGGTVTFKDGATTLGTGSVNPSGLASFSTSSLGAGTHSISAVYGGDPTFAGSTSAPVSEVVGGASGVPMLGEHFLFLLGLLLAAAGAFTLRARF